MWRIGLGLLAVAGEPGGGERVERHALVPAGQQRLADARPGGTRPGSCGHGSPRRECELAMIAISAGSRSNASMPPASMSATTPNGLTVERRVTTRSGSPSWRISRPPASASTMSPRWTLSSMPLRSWRTRIGVSARARPFARGRPVRGVARSAVAVTAARIPRRGRGGAFEWYRRGMARPGQPRRATGAATLRPAGELLPDHVAGDGPVASTISPHRRRPPGVRR